MRVSRTHFSTLLMIGAVALAGCSKSSKSTNPATTALVLNSGNLAQGGQYDKRFFTAGIFPYHCSIHSSMTGAITVSDAAPVGDTVNTVSIAGFAFSPASITIHTGGHVTWTNNQNTTHTVTSN